MHTHNPRHFFCLAALIALALAACAPEGDGEGNGTANNGNNGNNGQTNNGQTNNGQPNNGQTNNGQPNNGNNGCDLACPAPAAACEGEVAVSYSGEGAVTGDCACDYAAVEARQDCAAAGQRCLEGACAPLPCEGVSCPALEPSCEGNTLRTWSGDGVCVTETGLCDYAAVAATTDCAAQAMVCVEGACVDLCADVDCAPPANTCEGLVAIQYSGPGACGFETGVCSYGEVVQRVDCAAQEQICQDGACVDLCAEVTCAPPANTCDGDSALQYSGDGVCDFRNGECDYGDVAVTLDCAGLLQVCQEGDCVDLCAGEECPPPDPLCDGDVAVQYEGDGACDFRTGSCDYAASERRTDCAAQSMVCVEGACVDLCADVDCRAPSAFCQDGASVRYSGPGACDFRTGQCDFSGVEARERCADSARVCQLGACVDLCDEVGCEAPAPSCEQDTRITYSGAGACSFEDGACDFAAVEQRTDCAAASRVCEGGACVDLCDGVQCPAPADSCQGNIAIQYSADGACNFRSGACSYAAVEQRVNCAARAQICQRGACVDLCADVDCAPPANFCQGSVAIRYGGAGDCDFRNGTCDFRDVEQRADCAATQTACRDGACVNLCANVNCAPPPDACEGQVAVRYTGAGACNFRDGVCDFSRARTRTDCASFGLVCQDAACIPDLPSTPSPGELIVSEVMQNPAAVSDNQGEWFEIYNTTSKTLILEGLFFTDNNRNSFTLANGGQIRLPGFGRMVLGNNADPLTNGGIAVDFQYTNFALANGDDTIAIYSGETLISTLTWDGGPDFPNPNGASMQLGAEAGPDDASDGAAWCLSRGFISGDAGDRGTPGLPNERCVLPEAQVSIYDLSDEGSPNNPGFGAPVHIEGVVLTMVGRGNIGRYLWAQEPTSGPFSGLYINAGELDTSELAPGDLVSLRGVYTEGSGGTTGLATLMLTEIVVEGAAPIPAPQVLSAEELADPERAERWESVLVQVNQVAVTSSNPDWMEGNFGEFAVGAGGLRIDDFLYRIEPVVALNDRFNRLTGILNYSFSNFKLEPRGAGDVDAGPMATREVSLVNFDVDPGDLTITQGERIRWTNLDIAPHTVTSGNPGDEDAGSYFDSPLLSQGQGFSWVFHEPGTWLYFSRPDPEIMRGYEVLVLPQP